jgi:Polyketide cyclase / dehydrase and lipid transport
MKHSAAQFPTVPEVFVEQPNVVEESVTIAVTPAAVYRAVSSIQRMREWSPEFLGAWYRRPVRVGTRFIGFNRRWPWIWFTTAVVTHAEEPREFAFRVTSFGIPVSEWGYRLTPSETGTLVTEYWRDLRLGRSAPVAKLMGLIFTGSRPSHRPSTNRAGMRRTLAAMGRTLEREDGAGS